MVGFLVGLRVGCWWSGWFGQTVLRNCVVCCVCDRLSSLCWYGIAFRGHCTVLEEEDGVAQLVI